ncbi:MAG: hypothetical protein CM15mP21_3500 [Hyphomicrobiales bacterium]|nr:MAG: hypothetical protein CM15mP21_3500 [Hyphomicrobiales bacterium]
MLGLVHDNIHRQRGTLWELGRCLHRPLLLCGGEVVGKISTRHACGFKKASTVGPTRIFPFHPSGIFAGFEIRGRTVPEIGRETPFVNM